MPAKTHGLTRDSLGRNTKEYHAWANMKDRCFNPNNQYFHCYGGRGITVCSRWLSFENFMLDVGFAPSSEHSLGRLNNDGDYCPGNVSWQTIQEQNSNKRNPPRRRYKFEALIPQIKKLNASGYSTRKIAEILGVGKTGVWKVLHEA